MILGALCSFLGLIVSLWTPASGPFGPAWQGQESRGGLVHAHRPASSSSTVPWPPCLGSCLTLTFWGLENARRRARAWDKGRPEARVPSFGPAWAGPLETAGGGGRGEPTAVVPARVKSAPGWGRGIVGPSEEGGRGGCTKQACMFPEWAALSWALIDRTLPLGSQNRLPRPDQPVWGGRRCGHGYWIPAGK